MLFKEERSCLRLEEEERPHLRLDQKNVTPEIRRGCKITRLEEEEKSDLTLNDEEKSHLRLDEEEKSHLRLE